MSWKEQVNNVFTIGSVFNSKRQNFTITLTSLPQMVIHKCALPLSNVTFTGITTSDIVKLPSSST